MVHHLGNLLQSKYTITSRYELSKYSYKAAADDRVLVKDNYKDWPLLNKLCSFLSDRCHGGKIKSTFFAPHEVCIAVVSKMDAGLGVLSQYWGGGIQSLLPKLLNKCIHYLTNDFCWSCLCAEGLNIGQGWMWYTPFIELTFFCQMNGQRDHKFI